MCIILSCFGSSKKQATYLAFKEFIEESFPDLTVFISFSSPTIIKKLADKGSVYKTLPQMMQYALQLGYKRQLIASVNIFASSEHQRLIDDVTYFQKETKTSIHYTTPLFKEDTDMMHYCDSLEKKSRHVNSSVINLYIFHSDISTNATAKYLKSISDKNLICSLEGSSSFKSTRESIRYEVLKSRNKKEPIKVQIIPLLLVSGWHFDKDVKAIIRELKVFCDPFIIPSFTEEKHFNLLSQKSVKEMFKKSILFEMKKLKT